ncbi:sigma-70 family RNA polymerase sigma factor [Jeotgalibacillus sp. R-1-5s-1]|uniref:sigma-70 family RNA polymerase sigma factor n=1 Tax=Jeotgalibacillus sp. R-1-5s-1 TaxID=2555897 RepID=UPI00106D6E8A|nr:sigma-70 family RNA polymerase sigma factor [Jeotgalibacillus sp. R-1-5s-1]TFD94375.1 sigma-70 family RNA polymerase sigma factor [Jeotgalibacillus sp. R-1-5s-1]
MNSAEKGYVSDSHMEEVMDGYGEYLIRLAFLYVKDWSAAEDMVQEVFITYYQKSSQFENRSSLKTYLAKITVNKCHDHLRSWKNKRSMLSVSMKHLLSADKSPEESFEHRETENELALCVLALPVKYREVIILYYYQELSITEMSGVLSCSDNTVKTRLRRAKKILQTKLDVETWEGLLDE